MRVYKDRDGDEWRENRSGTFDLYFDGIYQANSNIYKGRTLRQVKLSHGPIEEITVDFAVEPVATVEPHVGEVRTVSSTGGEKGSKPARFDLIPAGPLWTLAELYGKGAEKYADRNWERGYEWSKSYAALCRHLSLFWQGVDIDDETGKPHLASVAWHAFALMEFAQTHPDFDDRPK